MQFGTIGVKRPESFAKDFRIYRPEPETSEMGRERYKPPVQIGEARCILSIAKPDEQQRFNQMGVTVTHTIFHTGKPKAKPNDIFVFSEAGKPARQFRVQATHDKGEMSIFTTYYCEERGDINGDID